MQGCAISTAKLLILGVAFKKNVDDIRNSPAIKVMELLLARGAQNLVYNDPHVPELPVNGKLYKSKALTEQLLRDTDCVVITTDHDAYDYDFIGRHARLIVDTRNATKSYNPEMRKKVIRLGCGTNSYHPNPQHH